MKKQQLQQNRKKIVVVSLFSGMDLFLLGMVVTGMLPGYAVERNIYAAMMHAANFINTDGTSVIEFINITEEEYKHRKTFTKIIKGTKKKPLEHTCLKTEDGQFIRTKEIQEVSGKEIRESIEHKFGKNIIVILIGGPPCQDFTPMNIQRISDGEESRNFLIFEFLRIVRELRPDITIMEEVPSLQHANNKGIYERFLSEAVLLPYRLAKQDMCPLHYGGNQNRLRAFFLFVDEKYNTDPCFPDADELNVKRVNDFLQIDYFCHGNFSYAILTKNDFMPTVTSGNPTAFYKDGKKFPPSIDDLLLCFDVVKGMYIIPEWIPRDQVKQAIGNAVCVSVVKALAKTITEKILRLKPDGNGYWISTDNVLGNDHSKLPANGTGGTDEIPGQNHLPESPASIEPSVARKDVPETTDVPTPIIGSQAPLILPPTQLSTPNQNFSSSISSTTANSTSRRKIISSLDLAGIRFTSLNFTGIWDQFIGQPTNNFHIIIHGKPGGGKSTFAIQFAKYLSDNFGKVIYISGEEGLSKTLQSKFLLTGSTSRNIDVADLRSYNDIIRSVASKSYPFIFIDSLNTMKISVDELRDLRNRYNESAIITISQATKGGLIRGSNELIHDCDVHLIVDAGIATTSKNRFRIAGETSYAVFSENNI